MWTQDLRESWPQSVRRTARNAAYLSLQGHEGSLWLKVSPALICLEATLGHQLLLCSEKGPGLAYKENLLTLMAQSSISPKCTWGRSGLGSLLREEPCIWSPGFELRRPTTPKTSALQQACSGSPKMGAGLLAGSVGMSTCICRSPSE